jgi:flagellar export protein FliJ
MQKDKVKKLKLIQRLLKNKLDAAASQYSVIAKMLKTEIEKNQQLQTYKQGYNNNLFVAGENSVSINTIKQKAMFIAHIEGIIQTQQYSILSLQKEVDARKSVWLTFRNKFERLTEYIERMKHEYNNELEIKEQKDLDTLVTDLHSFNLSVEK